MNNETLYIEDFQRELGGKISGNIKTFCPFCHKNRHNRRDKSFSINCQTMAYHCHYCGAAGYLKSRVEETIRHFDRQYKKSMNRTYTKPKVKPNIQLALDAAMVEYFKGRGVSEKTLLKAKVTKETAYFGQDGKKRGCIAFNYYVNGEHINTKYRTRDKHFTFIAGAQSVPYNIDSIAESSYSDGERKYCIITEGEVDTLSYIECGYTHSVSMPNGANANLEWMDDFVESHFDKMEVIYISTDSDRKGVEAREELIRRFGADIVKVVTYPEDCKDINEVLVKHGRDEVKKCFDNAADIKPKGIIELSDVSTGLDDLFFNGLQRGMTIGIPTLDEILSFKTGMLTIVTGVPTHGKALSLDTPLPTPYGWTTMGDVKVGDKLYDDEGNICTVTFATPVQYNRKCYRMTFSDGSQVICDEEHLWVTRDDKARRSMYHHRKRVERNGTEKIRPRGTDKSEKRTFQKERTTKEIIETLRTENGKRANHAVALQGALDGIRTNVPIQPYVLGVWLAEGTTGFCGITTGDKEIIDRIASFGYEIVKRKDKYTYGVHGIVPHLRALEVLNDKRIPQVYMRLPFTERLELMRGMMDGDGTCHKDGTCSYSTSKKELADDFYELLMTMGVKATITKKMASFNGENKKYNYRVNFHPYFKCFTLERKNSRIHSKYADDVNWRYVRKIESVGSVPVRCIQVDSPHHMYLCGKSMIPTHNTYALNFMLSRLNMLHDWKVAFFSPEFYPVIEHIAQIIETLGGKRFNKENYDLNTFSLLKDYVERNFFWIDPDDTDINRVLERGRYLIRKKGIKAFVIDPFNALTDKARKTVKQDEYISEFLQKIRWFARKYDVAIFLVMHPTKQQKQENGLYPVVDLYACKGASEIYDKADIGITIWRNESENYGEFHVTKMKFRHLGQKGDATFKFNVFNGRYVSIPSKKEIGSSIMNYDVVWDNSNWVIEKAKASEQQLTMTFSVEQPVSDLPFGAPTNEDAPF